MTGRMLLSMRRYSSSASEGSILSPLLLSFAEYLASSDCARRLRHCFLLSRRSAPAGEWMASSMPSFDVRTLRPELVGQRERIAAFKELLSDLKNESVYFLSSITCAKSARHSDVIEHSSSSSMSDADVYNSSLEHHPAKIKYENWLKIPKVSFRWRRYRRLKLESGLSTN
jgi:hypothetical protein